VLISFAADATVLTTAGHRWRARSSSHVLGRAAAGGPSGAVGVAVVTIEIDPLRSATVGFERVGVSGLRGLAGQPGRGLGLASFSNDPPRSPNRKPPKIFPHMS